MTEKIIILLFTELGFFLLCYILWKFFVEFIASGLFDIFLSIIETIEERLRFQISTGFILFFTIFANFLNYIFVIVGTSFDITCSWQSHLITFTTKFFIQKLEFLVKVFKSLVPALKTVCLEFLKFHDGVTSDIESFLRTFIAISNGSDYTGSGIYISKFFKFPNIVTSNIESFLHNLIASSTESGYTWAGISVLLFVIFIYGCIWYGVIWSKIFIVVLVLIGAPFEYAFSIVDSLRHDEIFVLLAQDYPFRALVILPIKIIEGIHSDVVNLLVLFPLEQYSWFYMFLFFFISYFFVKIMNFLVRNPALILIIIWAAGWPPGGGGPPVGGDWLPVGGDWLPWKKGAV